MSTPQLVRDTSGTAVQALLPSGNTTQTTSGSSQRITLPNDTKLVRIASTVDVYVAFGGSGVNASSSSMLFPIGAEIFNIHDPLITHVAFLQVGAIPGVFSATKMA